jgi:2-methylcitrate dehydratase PrpD
MGIIEPIIKNLADTEFETLPSAVIEASKKQILDTMAVSIGGSTCSISNELQLLVDMVKGWGGKQESTVLGFGGKLPAPEAGFLNGILSVRLDFDDSQVVGLKIHPSRSIVPPALALAEQQGNISGKKFLTAVALGHDLTLRLRQAVGVETDSSFSMVTNFLGATAAAGKIIGLTQQQFEAALGLAFHQASGAQSSSGTAGAGAVVKGLNNGVAVKTGITSALFAQIGFTGSQGFLEEQNKRNFYKLFFDGHYIPSILTRDLGKVFMGVNACQKPYPCCHGQHTAIEATLSLLKEHNINSTDIKQVEVYVGQGDYDYLAAPAEKKQNPANIVEAQFSLYWGIASAIIYREVVIRNFTREAILNPEIKNFIPRISITELSEFNTAGGFTPARVKIFTQSGMSHTKQINTPFGSPTNPMSFADTAEKFKQCCEYSVKPISAENQEKIIQSVNNIERIDDFGKIMNLMA